MARLTRLMLVLVIVLFTVIALSGCSILGLLSGDDSSDSSVAAEDNSEDSGDSPAPGTITVTLTGASAAEGDYFYVLAYETGEWRIDMPAYVRGAGQAAIASGSATFVLKDSIDGDWMPVGETWNADAGAVYDIYGYLLSSSAGDMVSVLDPWPLTLAAIDGDKSVNIDFTDLQSYVPTSGTLTLTISGATDYAGKTLYIGVLNPGDDPLTVEPIADGSATIASDGTAEILAVTVPTGGTWSGTGDDEYDVYAFIDMNGNGESGGPDVGDMVYDPAPVTYWQYGDKEMPTEASDYEPYTS